MGQPKRNERGLNPGKCPLTAAMTVVGSKWAGIVWWRLSEGPAATEELRDRIDGISRKMLAEQLRHFEEEGIVERCGGGAGEGARFALTEYGRTLEPVYTALCQWGAAHLQRTAGAEVAAESALDTAMVK